MRYAMFSTADDPAARLGVIHASGLADVQKLLVGPDGAPNTVLQLIQAGPAMWRRVSDRLSDLLSLSGTSLSGSQSSANVRWHAPIPRPLKNIVCLGLNYASHVRETT